MNKKDIIKLKHIGKTKQISVKDLSYEEQESIKRFMDWTDTTLLPNIYKKEIEVDVDITKISINFLGECLKDCLQEGLYERIEEIKKELIRRGYKIEIKINNSVRGTLIITNEKSCNTNTRRNNRPS